MTNKAPPKYDVAIVEALVLELAAELHPKHFSVFEITRRIVNDLDDDKEVKTVTQAISQLRRFGLAYDCKEEIVKLTESALHLHTIAPTYMLT